MQAVGQFAGAAGLVQQALDLHARAPRAERARNRDAAGEAKRGPASGDGARGADVDRPTGAALQMAGALTHEIANVRGEVPPPAVDRGRHDARARVDADVAVSERPLCVVRRSVVGARLSGRPPDLLGDVVREGLVFAHPGVIPVEAGMLRTLRARSDEVELRGVRSLLDVRVTYPGARGVRLLAIIFVKPASVAVGHGVPDVHGREDRLVYRAGHALVAGAGQRGGVGLKRATRAELAEQGEQAPVLADDLALRSDRLIGLGVVARQLHLQVADRAVELVSEILVAGRDQ